MKLHLYRQREYPVTYETSLLKTSVIMSSLETEHDVSDSILEHNKGAKSAYSCNAISTLSGLIWPEGCEGRPPPRKDMLKARDVVGVVAEKFWDEMKKWRERAVGESDVQL